MLNHYYHNNPIRLSGLFKQKCFLPVLPTLNPSFWSVVKDFVVVVVLVFVLIVLKHRWRHLSRRQKAKDSYPLAEVSCARGPQHPLKAFGLQGLLQNGRVKGDLAPGPQTH